METTELNLYINSFVMIKYDKKFSKPEYRMSRVIEVQIDLDSLVRTVEAGMRPRSKSLQRCGSPYKQLLVLLSAENIFLPRKPKYDAKAVAETGVYASAP